ncbi:apolipoprotein N-acyltransferase [Sphingomonas sp. SRS2]|uniref:apolipoprotein N-acyltransferase n=1 Tax=Sphingomonas sp. SRS2 TaxID=133190 RepID=UPI0006184DA9|nr:apolipoprotein N-acyltransferase [Sphingomonas sp. SRS2]KKC27181.1 acyltransferase [Sphingomonas sp. SRS2]
MRKLNALKYPSIAFGLGLASALGFAPLNWWFFTLLCLAGLMWLLLDAGRLRQVAARGWCFGVGHFTFGNNWIATAFTFQDKMPHWLGWVAVFLLALYLAAFPMLGAMLAWSLNRLPMLVKGRRHQAEQAARRNKLKGLIPPGMESASPLLRVPTPSPYAFMPLFAGSWVLTEYLRSIVFTGFAWNPLAAIMIAPGSAEPAWMGLTRLIGTYGLSGVMVLLASIWLLAVLPGTGRARWKRVALALIAAMLAQIVSAYMLRPLPPRAGPRIVVVQPNINQNQKWDPKLQAANFTRLSELSGKAGATPRLVLWPEAATADYLEIEPEARARIARLLGPKDIVLLGGDALIFDKAGDLIGARNSVFGLDAKGAITGRYAKAHLVPYGEYLPARPILSAIGLSRLVQGDIDFWPGPGPASFAVPGFGKAGMQVCYEIIFSGQVIDRANRPDFLFNPSNDAWFGRWGPPQHLAQARLRAAEEGMPIIRSTPTGISAVIDADGRLLHSLPWKKAGAIEATLPGPRPATPFARFGNLLPLLFAALLIAGGIAIAMKRR